MCIKQGRSRHFPSILSHLEGRRLTFLSITVVHSLYRVQYTPLLPRMSIASLSPPPPEGPEFYDVHERGRAPLVMSTDTPISLSLSSSSPLTRTVAILKAHALQDRLDIIEPRLLEANFEVSAVRSSFGFTWRTSGTGCQGTSHGVRYRNGS